VLHSLPGYYLAYPKDRLSTDRRELWSVKSIQERKSAQGNLPWARS
jgi:hypothetical protein